MSRVWQFFTFYVQLNWTIEDCFASFCSTNYKPFDFTYNSNQSFQTHFQALGIYETLKNENSTLGGGAYQIEELCK